MNPLKYYESDPHDDDLDDGSDSDSDSDHHHHHNNPQNFIMEAYADPLKYYEPDPPNTTNPKEVAERLAVNDEEVGNDDDDDDDDDDAGLYLVRPG